VTLCVQSLGAKRLRNNDLQDKCHNTHQHMNLLLSLNFPTRTPAAEGQRPPTVPRWRQPGCPGVMSFSERQ
jgi:hypothetical protein